MTVRAWEFSGYDEDLGELTALADPKFRGITEVRKVGTRPGDAPPLILKSLDALRAHPSLVTIDLSFEVEVTDISAVAELPNLEWLELGDVHGDLAPLAQCHKVTHLRVKGDRVTTLEPLFALAPRLTWLAVTQSALRSLDGIARFVHLEHLSVEQSKVSRLPHLPPGLHSVDLGYLEHLDDVSALAQCPRLEKVDLSYSPRVRDLSPLRTLPLVTLALNGLTRLREADLSPLTSLHALRELNLCDVQLHRLDVLAELPALRSLALYNCPNLAAGEVARLAPRLEHLEVLHTDAGDEAVEALRTLLPHASVNNNEPLRPRRGVRRERD